MTAAASNDNSPKRRNSSSRRDLFRQGALLTLATLPTVSDAAPTGLSEAAKAGEIY